MPEQSIIDVVINRLNLGPCGEYLERHMLKTVNKLFEIMQEYCKSDRGKWRRLEEMNERKNAKSNQRDQLTPWHADQLKAQKAVNTVSWSETYIWELSAPPSELRTVLL